MVEQGIPVLIVRIAVGITSDEDRTVIRCLGRKESRRARAETNLEFRPAVGLLVTLVTAVGR